MPRNHLCVLKIELVFSQISFAFVLLLYIFLFIYFFWLLMQSRLSTPTAETTPQTVGNRKKVFYDGAQKVLTVTKLSQKPILQKISQEEKVYNGELSKQYLQELIVIQDDAEFLG